MRKNIGYHTRDRQTGAKLTGGSFRGQFNQETVEDLVRAHFTVEILNSGTPVFVDKQGRRVWIYITVDPESTEIGQEALAAWRKRQDEMRQAEEEAEAPIREELEELLDGMSPAEALRRLKGTE